MSMAEAISTANPSVGNTKPATRTRRRRNVDQDRESLPVGDLVFQRINPLQCWTIIGREQESGLWACQNERGVTVECFTHELQRVDQKLTLASVWERETLGKRDSSLTATVLQVSRGYGYIVVLLSTGRPVMLYPGDLPDWFRVTAAPSQSREAA